MSPRPDPDALGFVLIDVARLLRSAFERRIAIAGLGLTPGEARTLVRISTLEGSRQLDIAQRMGIEPMTLSTYLDRLQSLGYIERRPDPADRRAKLIFTTPSGSWLVLARLLAIIGNLPTLMSPPASLAFSRAASSVRPTPAISG